ncbi:MAG: DinB family protein [Anaerolineaceae bacterium]
MKLTVLIDLDDTLLSNDMDTFLKVYLKALGTALSPFIPPERMVPQLLSATRMMSKNTSPEMRLEEVFDLNFYPPLGFEKKDLTPTLLDFYRNEFPKIQSVTEQRQPAVRLMDKMIAAGWDVVIATNPLFPHAAVIQRALWAGFESHLPAIKTITSFENFHFAKPNPAYYAEILGQLGWPNQPAVMIGNSLSDDILPAALLGLPVFWINDHAEPLPASLDGGGGSGGLDGVFPWLESILARGKASETKDPNGLLAILAATPAVMESFCQPLSDSDWKNRPGENEWSPTEIICHMRDVDRDVNLVRLPLLMEEQNPFLQAVDSDPWAVERSYQTQDGKQALSDFIQNRIKLLEILANLPAEGWKIPARHAIFGPITLQELVGIIISHDQAHLNQMFCTLDGH